ncbi:MAG: hypothetical protein ACQEW9_14355 [Bacteroidota bacterium]|uniref:NVEALA protein n=1 Tax=Algoriphagus faecimaris TaxID=686796 RepID=A0A1G6WBZ4_9BACT|nr:hypothetical protein [Algoriphagus faecimaris]SDD63470.1 hypothetical protein SAMN04488104_10433 [Algoriphagus faecimaris]
MKKVLFGVAFLGAMMCTIFVSYGQASVDPSEGEPCEDSIDIDGETITVTVCGRKTNLWGLIDGIDCNADATTSCSFTN